MQLTQGVSVWATMHGKGFDLKVLLTCEKMLIKHQLFIAIVMLELIVNIKFGFEEFSRADRSRIVGWVLIMVMSTFIGLIICYASGYIKQRIAPVKYSTFDASGRVTIRSRSLFRVIFVRHILTLQKPMSLKKPFKIIKEIRTKTYEKNAALDYR